MLGTRCNNRIQTLITFALAAILLVGVTSISAQDSGTDGQTDASGNDLVISSPDGVPTTTLPRDSVSGGSVRSRAPGLNISEAIRRHNAFQNTTLPYYDTTGGEQLPSERDMFLVELLNKIFDALYALILGIGGGVPTTLPA